MNSKILSNEEDKQDNKAVDIAEEIKQFSQTTQMQEGWQCPICKAVMAPWKPSCINCTGIPQLTITPLTPDITLLKNISISGDAQCSN